MKANLCLRRPRETQMKMMISIIKNLRWMMMLISLSYLNMNKSIMRSYRRCLRYVDI